MDWLTAGEASAGPPERGAVDGLEAVVQRFGAAMVVEVSGEVDTCTGSALREVLDGVFTDRPSVLVIDLTAVAFFGSAGLAVLHEAQQKAGAQTALRVVAATTRVLRPLQVTGLDQQFALYPTQAAALADSRTA